MKIALIATTDAGGAGRAAVRLNKGLNSIDVDCSLIVKQQAEKNRYKTKKLNTIDTDNQLSEFFQYIYKNNTYPGNTMMSTMYPSTGFNYLQELAEYDVINLHWIANYISLEAIEHLAYLGKKLVWTLHDQNPITGGCHYTHGCDKYTTDCIDCPQMITDKYNYAAKVINAKYNHIPKELVIVSPSQWLAECAGKSKVFKKHRIEVIKNSLETDIFKPVDKSIAKEKIGINKKQKVILFGAENHKETRKGFKELIDIMHIFKQKYTSQGITVVTFGKSAPSDIEFEVKSLGYIKNDEKLANIYSAADVVAFSSLEDNLPNIILESISCNTPIIAYKTGGMPDVVIDDITGYCVKYKDNEAFAEKLHKILFNNITLNCRKYAEENFVLQRQAELYKALYEDIIPRKQDISKANNVPNVYPETSQALLNYLFDYSITKQGILDKTVKKLLKDMKNGLVNTFGNFD